MSERITTLPLPLSLKLLCIARMHLGQPPRDGHARSRNVEVTAERIEYTSHRGRGDRGTLESNVPRRTLVQRISLSRACTIASSHELGLPCREKRTICRKR